MNFCLTQFSHTFVFSCAAPQMCVMYCKHKKVYIVIKKLQNTLFYPNEKCLFEPMRANITVTANQLDCSIVYFVHYPCKKSLLTDLKYEYVQHITLPCFLPNCTSQPPPTKKNLAQELFALQRISSSSAQHYLMKQ